MEKGFTIIEISIAIAILLVAVVGIFNAFSIVTILTSDSANRFTATYLAQEGMEIVRNIRDSNWLQMDADSCQNADSCSFKWLDNGLDACDNGCGADYTSLGVNSAEAGNWLCVNDVNGAFFYDYSSCSNDGVQSKFKRKIIITPINDVDYTVEPYTKHIADVKVEVSWNTKATILDPCAGEDCNAGTCGKYNCITAEETLYNWYNYKNR